MTHVTCRLTAKNRDQLRNPTLGNRVWATFIYGSPGIANLRHRSRSRELNLSQTQTLGVSWPFQAKRAIVVGFHCDVVSCNLARRGVRRGEAACGLPRKQRAMNARTRVVGVTLIQHWRQHFGIYYAFVSGTPSIGSIDSPLSSSITPHSFIPGVISSLFCISFPSQPSFTASGLTSRIPQTVYRYFWTYPFFTF